MLRQFATWFNDVAKRHMWTIGTASVGARYFTADCMVQSTEIYSDPAKGEHVLRDWKRTLLLTSFGMMYAGGAGSLFYTKIYPRLFPRKPVVAALLDVTIQMPVVYMSQYYLMAEFIKDTTSSAVSVRPLRELLASACATWKANIAEDVRNLLSFWGPMQLMTFGVVPVHLRIVFMSVVGFFWSALMSRSRGKTMHDEEEACNQDDPLSCMQANAYACLAVDELEEMAAGATMDVAIGGGC